MDDGISVEEHSNILKFRCLKLLGHCNRFSFLLRFFLYFMTFCVLIYLIDHVYISLAFDFWQVFPFGIQYLAFGSSCGICFLAYSGKHFVCISSVSFWHLYSTHTFHQRLGSFLARSCTCSYLRNSDPAQSKYPICMCT